jgi:hypothetical protein
MFQSFLACSQTFLGFLIAHAAIMKGATIKNNIFLAICGSMRGG